MGYQQKWKIFVTFLGFILLENFEVIHVQFGLYTYFLSYKNWGPHACLSIFTILMNLTHMRNISAL